MLSSAFSVRRHYFRAFGGVVVVISGVLMGYIGRSPAKMAWGCGRCGGLASEKKGVERSSRGEWLAKLRVGMV